MNDLASDDGFAGVLLHKAEGMTQSEKDKAFAHAKRMGAVGRVLERLSNEQADKITNLMAEIGVHLQLSGADIEQLTAAVNMAHWKRKVAGGCGAIGLYLASVNDAPQEPRMTQDEGRASVPSMSDAPRNSFGGVTEHGDPYAFLMEHYGPWLQPRRKCLDRPTLMEYDPKLLKALQQRYTRDNDSMPPLSTIFPGKIEARENRMKFMHTQDVA